MNYYNCAPILRDKAHKEGLPVHFKAAILSYLFLVFVATVCGAWLVFESNSVWKVGDWLINYQGGFVRRGLIGELFFVLSSWTGLSPVFFVFATQVACYFFYFLFSGLLLTRQRRALPFIILLLSPFIFLFQIHDFQGGYRKEIVYFAILAFAAWTASNYRVKIFEIATISVLVIYPLVILMHETLAIFLPYILVIYALRVGFSTQRVIWISVLIVPSIIAFLLSLRYPGTTEQVFAICDSLGSFSPKNCDTEGAISWLDNSAHFGMQAVRSNVLDGQYLKHYSFVVILSFVAYIPVLGRLKKILSNKLSLLFVVTSILGSSALFLVAIDWGRFIYIHLVSIFILSLLIPDEIDQDKGRETLRLSRPFTERLDCKAIATYAVLFLFIIGYSTLWHIPHAAGEPFISNQTARVWGVLLWLFTPAGAVLPLFKSA